MDCYFIYEQGICGIGVFVKKVFRKKLFHLVEIVVTQNLWSQNTNIFGFITVAISKADEIQSDILI